MSLDRTFTLVSIILAVVFGAITVWALVVTIRSRPRHQLTWSARSLTPLATLPDTSPSKFEMFYDGKKISRPVIEIIRIENTGNRAIPARDIEDPIYLSSESGVILDADVCGASSAVLESVPLKVQDERQVVIEPRTLNVADWVDIRIIYDGSEAKVWSVGGGIIDIPSIQPEKKSGERTRVARRILGESVSVEAKASAAAAAIGGIATIAAALIAVIAGQ